MYKISKIPTTKENGHKSAPKGYPKKAKMYADPKNFKYPLDTEKHVRAALAYFSEPKNQKGYSSSEIKTMFSRIYKRCKDYGIQISKKEASNELLIKIASIANTLEKKGFTKEAAIVDSLLNNLIG